MPGYGPELIAVPSRTRPGTVYHVNPIQFGCQCDGFRFRKWCRHLSIATGQPEDDMTTQLEPRAQDAPAVAPETMAAVLGSGDLAKLTPGQRVEYLNALCRSVGLNPLTRPFEFIQFQNKVQIYASANAFQQLAGIHKATLRVDDRTRHDDGWEVWVTAIFPDGREVQDVGWVGIGKAAGGEAVGNALKKAVTQGYRRAVRAAVGLPFMSPEEVDSLPNYDVRRVTVDHATGEIQVEPQPVHTVRPTPERPAVAAAPEPDPPTIPPEVQTRVALCETPQDFTDLLVYASEEGWRNQPWARMVNADIIRAAGTRGIAHSPEAGWYYVSDADPEPALFGAEVA